MKLKKRNLNMSMILRGQQFFLECTAINQIIFSDTEK